MKIESFGNFVLESRLSECTLHFGANLVCIHGDCINDCKDNADCIFSSIFKKIVQHFLEC